MKKVLVQLADGRLCDIVAPGADFSVAPGLQWFDAPDDVAHDTHEFNGTSVVAKPPEPIAVVKERKLAELRRARDAACNANVTVAGKTFSAEPQTQTGIKRMADRLRRGKASKLNAILDVDGNPVTVGIVLLDAIDDAIADNAETAWNHYGALVQQVNAATTAAQIDAIVW